MNSTTKILMSACIAVMAPLAAAAATVVTDGGGPYDVTSDTLFTGIAQSSADGAGSYVIEFFTPGATVRAVADAAVTVATVNESFANLTMSWIDGLNLNTLVSAAGVDTLTTVFDTTYPVQQLRFDWTDSDAQAGFRFDVQTDVQTGVAPVPVPASVLFLAPVLAGLGFAGRRRRGGPKAG